jgi:hypothetical protein
MESNVSEGSSNGEKTTKGKTAHTGNLNRLILLAIKSIKSYHIMMCSFSAPTSQWRELNKFRCAGGHNDLAHVQWTPNVNGIRPYPYL